MDTMVSPSYQNSTSRYATSVYNISGEARVQFGDTYPAPDIDTSLELQIALRFPEILNRYNLIEDCHHETCRWVFSPVESAHRPLRWDNFLEWLRNGSAIYWISGKPGSGKSTMLKYLAETIASDNPSSWKPKIVLTFWFWEAGTDLQKNTVGFLRSLLWQLLRSPSLRDMAYHFISTHTSDGQILSKRNLTKALTSCLDNLEQNNHNFSIILDGLDEAGEDADDIIEILELILASHRRCRICVSSRPEQKFVETFLECPMLKLQDLNQKDIERYVDERFLRNNKVQRILKGDTSIGRELRNSLCDRADGVFLWICLVVQDLIRGIMNRDNLEVLHKRIENLPEDLNKLYDAMLRRNSPDLKYYAQDAAFYCSLILKRTMYLSEFCIAVDSKARSTILQSISSFTDWETITKKVFAQHEEVEAWVNIRSAGLLQVSFSNAGLLASQAAEMAPKTVGKSVNFIHRTARAYVLEATQGQGVLADLMLHQKTTMKIFYETWLITNYVVRGLVILLDEMHSKVGFHALLRCWPRESPSHELLDVSVILWRKLREKELLDDAFPTQADGDFDLLRVCCMSGWYEIARNLLYNSTEQFTTEYLSRLLDCERENSVVDDTDAASHRKSLFEELLRRGADLNTPYVSNLNHKSFPGFKGTWLAHNLNKYVSGDSFAHRGSWTEAALQHGFRTSVDEFPFELFARSAYHDAQNSYLWGEYCIADLTAIYSEKTDSCLLTATHQPSRIYVLLDIADDPQASSPSIGEITLFAVAQVDSDAIIAHLKYIGGADFALNTIALRSSLSESAVLQAFRAHAQRLSSLVEALLYIGKTPEYIKEYFSRIEEWLYETRALRLFFYGPTCCDLDEALALAARNLSTTNISTMDVVSSQPRHPEHTHKSLRLSDP